MKKAVTDSEWSIQSNEFVWSAAGLTEAHVYLLPTLKQWLREANVTQVLDLGCGNAAVTQELAKLGFEMTGLDSSASGIAIASQACPSLELIRAGLELELPRELRGRFDAVIAVEAIEHLLLPRCLFHRAKEALGRRGIFILTTPYHGFWKNLALALANRFDEHWHPLRDHGHVKFFSRKTIVQLFAEQGFKVSRFRRSGRCPPLAKSMIVQGNLVAPD